MKVNVKHLGAALLSMALAVTTVVPGGAVATAAKAPAMAKKSVSVNVRSVTTIKLKNVNKKAKVAWSSKSKKIAKITKASKTSAKVKGMKKGTTKVTAKYSLGKVKKTLTCKVKVKAANIKATQAPANDVPAATATTAPTVTPAATASATAAPSTEATASPTATPDPTEAPFGWTSTWGTAEEPVENQDGVKEFIPLAGTTVRQIIKVTTTGDKFRLRLSNQYGKSAVKIDSIHVAKQGAKADKSDIDVSTDTVVTYKGAESFEIPAGEVIQTDEIDFKVNALENVAVTSFFGDQVPTTGVTGHRGARATTYQVQGNEVSAEKLDTLSGYKTCTGWFFIADASVWMRGGKAVVCFGDSITDGYGTDASYLGKKPDSYTRWGDYFAKRLQNNEATKNVSVINEGIGGNSIFGGLGPAGRTRFERDLSEHDNVAYCIILFGVNDMNSLPDTSMWDKMKPEYEKMIETCHDYNVKVYAAPILPFGSSSYYSEGSEEVRNLINNWFRSDESGVDGIIDFDKAVMDPNNPTRILEAYTHEDGLHPYDGYEAMAEAIDLNMFK